MDRKKLVLLLAALVVAIGTALAARSIFAGAAAPQANAVVADVEPDGPKVLVAKRALPIGTIVTPDAVGYQLWPKELVQDAYFIEGEADMEALLNTVVRNPITAGQPMTRGSLVAPGDRGFLAAALGPGMRAITVPVSATSGVGGFIFPGDHVDLILTQTVEGEGESLKAAETIMRNLRVLATDRSTESQVGPDGKTVVSSNSNVTLEVTPRIAEKITVAQQIGSLSLSLRSIADNQSELERALAAGEVDLPNGASKQEEERLLRLAVRRPQEGPSSYVTGGDVSRFETRALPRTAPAQAAAPAAYSGPVPSAPARPAGPVVRVTRGQDTSETSVAHGAGDVLHGQSRAIGSAGRMIPAATGTLR